MKQKNTLKMEYDPGNGNGNGNGQDNCTGHGSGDAAGFNKFSHSLTSFFGDSRITMFTGDRAWATGCADGNFLINVDKLPCGYGDGDSDGYGDDECNGDVYSSEETDTF